MQHCPSNCHTHAVQTFAGVAGGSFTAPDHEYPSYLELELTATDSGGLTDTKTIRLDPRTVTLTFSSIPGGLQPNRGQHTGHRDLHQNRHPWDPRTQCRPSHRRPRARRTTPSRHGPTAARKPTPSPLRPQTPPTQPASDEPPSRRCRPGAAATLPPSGRPRPHKPLDVTPEHPVAHGGRLGNAV